MKSNKNQNGVKECIKFIAHWNDNGTVNVDRYYFENGIMYSNKTRGYLFEKSLPADCTDKEFFEIINSVKMKIRAKDPKSYFELEA